MARLLNFKTFTDNRGSLTIVEKEIPFQIKRVYYAYNVEKHAVRAGHRHKKNIQILICVRGSCEIYVNDGYVKKTFVLDRPDLGLLLEPEDWHTMYNFSGDAVLMVLASEPYDINDYIDEEYE